LISAVVYLVSFSVLTPRLGLIGPGIAAAIAALLTLIGISFMVAKSIREAARRTDV